ncbi:MAG TPA: class I SAM-dependent methyltransferase [Xanthobacteraceae bacterium]
MRSQHRYVLGHDAREIERLQLQAAVIGPVTRRLIEQSGIRTGMHVLDIGCGPGDVSMLLADAVGETGRVVAVDREPRAIAVARMRAQSAGYRQIEFMVASDESFATWTGLDAGFDAALGRYILISQADPVAMIRRAAAAVRCGGIVAFHEPASEVSGHTFPSMDLYATAERRLNAAFRATIPHIDAGCRLFAYFEAAGLAAPRLIWESIAGGPESPLWRLFAMTYRSMFPHIARVEPALTEADDPDSLAERLIAAAAAARAQIVSKPQSCAWAIKA